MRRELQKIEPLWSKTYLNFTLMKSGLISRHLYLFINKMVTFWRFTNSRYKERYPLERTTIELRVICDTCLGYQVFRGSAPAKDIVEAAWIDFHDPDRNRLGYQRAFDQKRSANALTYAEESDEPFWPECILAIRNDEDLEEQEKIEWVFKPDRDTGKHFGTLEVSYTKGLTSNINENSEPWRRAFSQVDCQHRLGSMRDSDKYVTFCIIPGITRRQEAILFRAINQNQKGIPTSLVDTIINVTDPHVPVHISWAWDLNVDVGSPFYKLVDTGGRGQSSTLIQLRGLQQSLKLLIPPKYIEAEAIDSQQGYSFARGFWQVIKDEWPTEFGNKTEYKMMVNPGVRALSRLGRRLFESKLDSQDFSLNTIRGFMQKGKQKVDWSADGALKDATGKGAEKRVFEQLRHWYGE